MRTTKPTVEAYAELQFAYEHYNDSLFGNSLPFCLITYQRKKKSYGYFSSRRWASGEDFTDEIALNPDYFDSSERSLVDVLSTLVHEMTHLQQFHFGKPGRGRYHNREWAGLMLEVGLYPSSTGGPGGKMTGDRVSHYVVEGGPFDVSTKSLLATGFKLSWIDSNGEERPEPEPQEPDRSATKKQTRQKFSCPDCGLNAWAKYEAAIGCWECNVRMRPVGIL